MLDDECSTRNYIYQNLFFCLSYSGLIEDFLKYLGAAQFFFSNTWIKDGSYEGFLGRTLKR